MRYNLHPDVEAFSTEIGEALPYAVLQPHQTHTTNVRIVTSRDTTREDLREVDALITPLADFAIAVRTADCVPVLLYDPVQHVCAAVHAGWRGTVGRISQKTIALMAQEFGSRAEDLQAVVGPSIGPDNFQVGEEVVEAFSAAGFPMDLIHTFRGPRREGSMAEGHHIDLWAANHWLLTEAGLLLPRVQVAGVCTYAHADRFYSARHDGNNHSRRIINVIKRKI